MTVQEYNQRIKNRDKLLVLDDLVLDVTNYIFDHPGGPMLIDSNVGRDISKFFYGGYQMENYNGSDGTHAHSSTAVSLLNSLAIAVLERQVP